MSKGPGLFSEIGKKARDLLTTDYRYDQKFTVTSTSSDVGVGLTSTVVKNGDLCTGAIAARYKYKNTFFNVIFDTESNISTTVTISEIAPSTTVIASFKVPDYDSGKLEARCFHENATFTTSVALSQSTVVDLSGTIGTPTFAFGVEAGYDTTLGSLTKYTAGISVTKQDSHASITFADKGDTLKASFVHQVDQLRSSGVAEITRRFSTNANTFTVGASYAFDSMTLVKTRFNNHGQLAALLQHQLKAKSILTISGELNAKALDMTPKFGLSIALQP